MRDGRPRARSGRLAENLCSVQLDWQTATELNNDYFDVEWSTDGINFEQIGQVQGAGTTNDVQFYEFLHHNPVIGENYYRLRQVDFDERFEYSNTVQITISEVTQSNNQIINVFPNPTINFITIEDASIGEIAQIFGVNGQLIEEFQIQASSIQFPVSRLPSGVYFIKIGDEVKRIVKE